VCVCVRPAATGRRIKLCFCPSWITGSPLSLLKLIPCVSWNKHFTPASWLVVSQPETTDQRNLHLPASWAFLTGDLKRNRNKKHRLDPSRRHSLYEKTQTQSDPWTRFRGDVHWDDRPWVCDGGLARWRRVTASRRTLRNSETSSRWKKEVNERLGTTASYRPRLLRNITSARVHHWDCTWSRPPPLHVTGPWRCWGLGWAPGCWRRPASCGSSGCAGAGRRRGCRAWRPSAWCSGMTTPSWSHTWKALWANGCTGGGWLEAMRCWLLASSFSSAPVGPSTHSELGKI